MTITAAMPATATATSQKPRERFGHPAGLSNLFFTEMWERFSYYGMRALLMLYMVAPVSDGGLGWDTPKAGSIYGLYTMAVYLSSIPGGLIADRFLGARTAILTGGIIIAMGHFSLAVPTIEFFMLGLFLIVFGTGLLKPNISALLGSLYPAGDERRDAGFSIFYMGINIGAALSPLVCGYLAQDAGFKRWLVSAGMSPHASWHWGFAAAGVGMIVGLIHFVIQRRELGDAGLKPKRNVETPVDGLAVSEPAALDVASPVLAAAAASVADDTHAKSGTAIGSAGAQQARLTGEEIKRLGAIAILFLFNIGFWAVYEQGGSSLNLFADRLTRCEVFGYSFPSSWFQSVPAAFVIALAPVISWVWLKLGSRQPSSPAKFAIGLFLLGAGTSLAVPATILAAHGKVGPMWLVGVYFMQTVGELCLSPVGLSTVTKLAPQRFVGMTMGVWFVSMAFGNYLAGYLAGFFDEKNLQTLIYLFGGMGVACTIATILLVILTPLVKKLMSGIR